MKQCFMNSRQIATWRQIIVGKPIYVKKVPSPDQFAFFERTLPHTRLPAFSVVSITTAAMVRLVLVSVLLLGLVAMATASPRSGPHAASNQSTHIVVCR